MVKIVTGKINDYKTTRLKDHYDKHLCGDGFIAIKRMLGDKVHSYELYKLSSKERRPYIIRDEFHDNLQTVLYKKGPYLFLKSAFDYLNNQINQMIEDKVSPIYLDEISLLELEGKGLYKILKKILREKIDCVLVVRQDLLDQILIKFSINNYELLGD